MTILTVGPASSFATIAAAMLAANPGDTIQLQAGYSNETATVTHNNMIFSGQVSSTGIVLQLATGIPTIFLAGSAPINVLDAPDGNGITGNDGSNVVTVRAGADAVNGGLGTDRLIVDYRLATGAVTGDSTTNFAEAGGGARLVSITDGTFENFTVLTGAGADTLTVGTGANIVNAGNGANTITAGNGPNSITGGDDADTITTGNGNNTIVAGAGANVIVAGQGANTITGGKDADTITAGDGGNYIDGGDGFNKITSGSGNDVLISGVGAATIVAGAGNDASTVRGGAANVDSGAGNDRLVVDYSLMTTAVTGGVTSGSLVAGYSGHIADATVNHVDFVATENFTITTGSANDVITTGDGNDFLSGGAGKDILNGGGGTNALYGNDGNDTLIAGTASPGGYNQLWGGNGADTADYSAQTSVVYVDLRPQAGYVDRGSGLVLTDVMNSVENATGGSANDTLVGDAGDNGLNGGGGSNVLYGMDGNDAFAGGTASAGGYNQLWGGNGSDTVDYSAKATSVYVDLRSQAGYLNAASPVLTDLMSSVENAVGGAGNDTLVGDNGANRLDGRGGTNVLYALDGNDTLAGGTATAGQNQLWGGNGSDTVDYSAQTASVYVDLGSGGGYVNNGGGLVLKDVMSSVENARGGSGNDTLVGDGGNNVLTGGGGGDGLYGMGGTNTFVYASVADSNLVTGYDSIVGFHAGIDKIDVSALGTDASHLFVQTSGTANSVYIEQTAGTFNAATDLAIGVTTTAAGGVHTSDFVF
jgi:Ca2+-binding RTX toxin-like protein